MLYFYHGQEDFNIEIELQKLKTKIVDKAFLATNYRVYNNPQFQEFIDILRTPSLMFGNVLVVINCEKYFFDTKGKINFDDKQLKQIEEAIETMPDSLHIVLVCKIERESTKKLDTRRKLYKIITKFATVQDFPEYKSYQKELATWIQKQVKKKDLIISSEIIQFLIERLGTNLRIIDNELEKLKLAIHPEKMIKKEHVQNICTSTEDIFVLTDYILKGQKDLALLEFKKLCTNKHYLEILAVLQTNFTKIAQMKVDSVSKNAFEIATKVHMPEFIVKKQLEKIKNIPMDKIIKIRQNLIEAEYRIKTGEISFYELPVEMAILG